MVYQQLKNCFHVILTRCKCLCVLAVVFRMEDLCVQWKVEGHNIS